MLVFLLVCYVVSPKHQYPKYGVCHTFDSTQMCSTPIFATVGVDQLLRRIFVKSKPSTILGFVIAEGSSLLVTGA